MKKENTVYMDMITTNYNGMPDKADTNDLVKVTIINDNGKLLLNTYAYPCNASHDAWTIALFVNNIPRVEITRAPNIDVVIANIRDIVTLADNIVVYNADKIADYFKKWKIEPIILIDVSRIPVRNYIVPRMPLQAMAYHYGYYATIDDYIDYNDSLHDTHQYTMMLRHIYHHIFDKKI